MNIFMALRLPPRLPPLWVAGVGGASRFAVARRGGALGAPLLESALCAAANAAAAERVKQAEQKKRSEPAVLVWRFIVRQQPQTTSSKEAPTNPDHNSPDRSTRLAGARRRGPLLERSPSPRPRSSRGGGLAAPRAPPTVSLPCAFPPAWRARRGRTRRRCGGGRALCRPPSRARSPGTTQPTHHPHATTVRRTPQRSGPRALGAQGKGKGKKLCHHGWAREREREKEREGGSLGALLPAPA